MADLPGMPSTIRCAVCGFENTTTSLYCQDCGQRLVPPPSTVAAESEVPVPATTTAPVRPRARIISTRRSSRSRSFLTIAIRTVIVAALAALVIQIIRTPVNVPPAALPLADNVVANVRAALQASAQRNGPFDAPWTSLNAYLAAVLQPGISSGALQTSFSRALLAPVTGGFSLFVERKVAGLPLYSRIDYRLISRGNGIDITPMAVSLGQLPLPGWAAPAIETMNGHLDQALATELGVLREAKAVRITPQKASLDFGPPRP